MRSTGAGATIVVLLLASAFAAPQPAAYENDPSRDKVKRTFGIGILDSSAISRVENEGIKDVGKNMKKDVEPQKTWDAEAWKEVTARSRKLMDDLPMHNYMLDESELKANIKGQGSGTSSSSLDLRQKPKKTKLLSELNQRKKRDLGSKLSKRSSKTITENLDLNDERKTLEKRTSALNLEELARVPLSENIENQIASAKVQDYSKVNWRHYQDYPIRRKVMEQAAAKKNWDWKTLDGHIADNLYKLMWSRAHGSTIDDLSHGPWSENVEERWKDMRHLLIRMETQNARIRNLMREGQPFAPDEHIYLYDRINWWNKPKTSTQGNQKILELMRIKPSELSTSTEEAWTSKARAETSEASTSQASTSRAETSGATTEDKITPINKRALDNRLN